MECCIVLVISGEVAVIIILFGESNLWICLLWILLYIVNLFVFGYWFILLNINKIGLLVFCKEERVLYFIWVIFFVIVNRSKFVCFVICWVINFWVFLFILFILGVLINFIWDNLLDVREFVNNDFMWVELFFFNCYFLIFVVLVILWIGLVLNSFFFNKVLRSEDLFWFIMLNIVI